MTLAFSKVLRPTRHKSVILETLFPANFLASMKNASTICRASSPMITTCLDDVAKWVRSSRLQKNTAKTEILWSTTGRRLHQLPKSPLGTDDVMPFSVVRDLGIYIDSDVSTMSHVTKTTCA